MVVSALVAGRIFSSGCCSGAVAGVSSVIPAIVPMWDVIEVAEGSVSPDWVVPSWWFEFIIRVLLVVVHLVPFGAALPLGAGLPLGALLPLGAFGFLLIGSVVPEVVVLLALRLG